MPVSPYEIFWLMNHFNLAQFVVTMPRQLGRYYQAYTGAALDSISQNKAALLELCLSSAMLLAPTGRILFANAAARELLGSHEALSSLDGILSTRRTEEGGQLANALTQTKGEASPKLVVLRSRTGVPVLALSLSPAPDGQSVIAIASDLSAPFKLSIDELRAFFGFTAAEARIAHGLANGQSAIGLAAAFGLSISTVRSYLRTLLLKAGAKSQSSLIAILLRAEHARSG